LHRLLLTDINSQCGRWDLNPQEQKSIPVVITSSLEERKRWIEEVEGIVEKDFLKER
jgi:hypothetical protein